MSKVLSIIAMAAALACSSVASAVPVIDQSNLNPTDRGVILASMVSNSAATSDIRQAQNLTVGIAGQLTRVDLQTFRAPDSFTDGVFRLAIYSGIRGDATSSLLGSVDIASSLMPTQAEIVTQNFIAIDVSSLGLFFEIGDVFSLEQSVRDPTTGAPRRFRMIFGYDTDGDLETLDDQVIGNYAGGFNQVYQSSQPEQGWVTGGNDRGFRTWVEPSEVPEAGALSLLAFGLLALALRRGRRN